MKAYVPARGDIVHIELEPAAEHEINGPHFGLVLSGKEFNKQGLAVGCPISLAAAATASTYGTVVTLVGCGTDTQGAVNCHQLKSLDWRIRKAKLKERAWDGLSDGQC